jgi:hypothetical protein
MILGKLHGGPVTRPTKSAGYVTFFKLKDGSEPQFWSVATFSDVAREELAGLAEGAAPSAAGQLHVETYDWKGETRVSLKLTADRVLALKPTRKVRPNTAEKPGQAGRGAADRAPSAWEDRAYSGRPFDDDVPF